MTRLDSRRPSRRSPVRDDANSYLERRSGRSVGDKRLRDGIRNSSLPAGASSRAPAAEGAPAHVSGCDLLPRGRGGHRGAGATCVPSAWVGRERDATSVTSRVAPPGTATGSTPGTRREGRAAPTLRRIWSKSCGEGIGGDRFWQIGTLHSAVSCGPRRRCSRSPGAGMPGAREGAESRTSSWPVRTERAAPAALTLGQDGAPFVRGGGETRRVHGWSGARSGRAGLLRGRGGCGHAATSGSLHVRTRGPGQRGGEHPARPATASPWRPP